MRLVIIYFALLLGCQVQTADIKSASQGTGDGTSSAQSAYAMEKLILYVLVIVKREYDEDHTLSSTGVKERVKGLIRSVEKISEAKNSPAWRRLASVLHGRFWGKDVSRWNLSERSNEWGSTLRSNPDIFKSERSGIGITLSLFDEFLQAHENEAERQQTSRKNNERVLDAFRGVPRQIVKNKLEDIAETETKRLSYRRIKQKELQQELKKKLAVDKLLPFIRKVAEEQRSLIKAQMLEILARKERVGTITGQALSMIAGDLEERESFWQKVMDKIRDRQPIPEYQGEEVELPDDEELREQNRKWWAINKKIVVLQAKKSLLDLIQRVREDSADEEATRKKTKNSLITLALQLKLEAEKTDINKIEEAAKPLNANVAGMAVGAVGQEIATITDVIKLAKLALTGVGGVIESEDSADKGFGSPRKGKSKLKQQ